MKKKNELKYTKNNNSKERKEYLRKIKIKKISVISVQILLIVTIIILWEYLAQIGKIDSFIASKPSRIIKTFMDLKSNNLLKHIIITVIETILGFTLRYCFRDNNCYNIMVV